MAQIDALLVDLDALIEKQANEAFDRLEGRSEYQASSSDKSPQLHHPQGVKKNIALSSELKIPPLYQRLGEINSTKLDQDSPDVNTQTSTNNHVIPMKLTPTKQSSLKLVAISSLPSSPSILPPNKYGSPVNAVRLNLVAPEHPQNKSEGKAASKFSRASAPVSSISNIFNSFETKGGFKPAIAAEQTVALQRRATVDMRLRFKFFGSKDSIDVAQISVIQQPPLAELYSSPPTSPSIASPKHKYGSPVNAIPEYGSRWML